MARAAVLGRLIWREASVAGVRAETSHARSLTLQVPGWPGHEAGQHVDLRLTAPDGYTATRAYSIATPSNGDLVGLTVDRVINGEVSTYLVDDVAIGDRLEIRGPLGGWFLWRPTQTEPVQLIGGGSGLVPLMAMIRSRSESGSSAPMRLLYSVRDPDLALYRDEIDNLGLHPSGVTVTVAYTRRPPAGGPPPGRIEANRLKEATFSVKEEPTCYVCGPTGFVETIADLLVQAGHPPDRIRTERFGPSGGPR